MNYWNVGKFLFHDFQNFKTKKPANLLISRLASMAGTTRLELATSAVTGRCSNRLNYVPNKIAAILSTKYQWAVQDLNL